MPAAAHNTFLEVQGANGRGLRVSFLRSADRWAHAIDLLNGPRTERLLETVEGTDADLWPPSPPLQSVHFEDRPGGQRVALAVGMAGRSHWSASVETQVASGATAFDIACRVTQVPPFLGITYRILGRAEFNTAHREILFPREGVRLVAISALLLPAPSGLVTITPLAPVANPPGTARWQYSLSLLT